MDDRGSALPAVLGMVLAGALVMGVAVDLARWASHHREVAAVADAAAQAGAVALVESELRAGLVVVDAEAATSAAQLLADRSRYRPGRSVVVAIESNAVCVTVRQPFPSPLLTFIGAAPAAVEAEGCAVPARG